MRAEIMAGCFQDLINNGFSAKAAAAHSLSLEYTANILLLKLGIEEPSYEQFSEVVACLSAVMQKGKELPYA